MIIFERKDSTVYIMEEIKYMDYNNRNKCVDVIYKDGKQIKFNYVEAIKFT